MHLLFRRFSDPAILRRRGTTTYSTPQPVGQSHLFSQLHFSTYRPTDGNDVLNADYFLPYAFSMTMGSIIHLLTPSP